MKRKITAIMLVVAILSTMCAFPAFATTSITSELFDETPAPVITAVADPGNDTSTGGTMGFSTFNGGTGSGHMSLTSLSAEIPTNGTGNSLKYIGTGVTTGGLVFTLPTLTVNKSYSVDFDLKNLTSSSITYTVNYGSTAIGNTFSAATNTSIHVTRPFTYAAASTSIKVFVSGVATDTFTIDNVKITENDAVVITNKPVGTLYAPGTLQLTTLASGAAVGGTVVWSSTNTAVATVDQNGLVTAVASGSTTIKAQIGSYTADSFTLGVNTTGFIIKQGTRPVNDTAIIGSSFTLYSLATNVSGSVTWTSSNTTVATIVSTTGAVTTKAEGQTTITATLGSYSDNFVLTVVPLIITPPATLKGSYMVLGDAPVTFGYSAGTGYTTGTATWASDTPTVATINSSTGAVSPVSVGTTTITVTVNLKSATFVLNVLASALAQNNEDFTFTLLSSKILTSGNLSFANKSDCGFSLTSNPAELPTNGSGQALKVTLNSYSNSQSYDGFLVNFPALAAGSYTASFDIKFLTVDPTNNTYYTSYNGSGSQFPAVAVAGVSTHVTKTFTYASGVNQISVFNSAANEYGSFVIDNFKIIGAQSVTIANKPTLNQMTIGDTAALTATNVGSITGSPAWSTIWSSTASPVVTVNSSTGLLTAVSAGTAVVAVNLGAYSDYFTVTVNSGIKITNKPAGNQMPANGTQALGCSLLGITGTPAWTSSAPSIATVDPVTGLLTAISNGTTTITVTLGGNTDSFVLTVTSGIFITNKPTGKMISGSTQALGCTLIGVTGTPAWTSSVPGVATVDPSSGLLTAVADGTTTITATLNGFTDSFSVIVYTPNAENFDNATINGTVGTGVMTFTANSTTTMSLTNLASDLPTNGSGNAVKFSSVAGNWPGITFTVSPVTANINYIVSFDFKTISYGGTASAPLISINFGGSTNFSNAVGNSIHVVKTLNSGTASSINVFLTESPAYNVGVGTGTFTIDNFKVTQVPTASITNKPTNNQMVAGDSAITLGIFLTGGVTGTPAWTSSTPATATIDPVTGALTPVAAGTTTIGLSIGGYTDSFILTVIPPAVAITNEPTNTTMTVGDSPITLGYAVTGQRTGSAVWTSSSTSVATIGSGTGILTAVSAGTTTITLTYGGLTANFILTVIQPSVSITNKPYDDNLVVGSNVTLGTTVTGGLTNSPVWTSSNTAIATVDSTGVVTAVAAGSTKITASIGSFSDSFYIVTSASAMSYTQKLQFSDFNLTGSTPGITLSSNASVSNNPANCPAGGSGTYIQATTGQYQSVNFQFSGNFDKTSKYKVSFVMKRTDSSASVTNYYQFNSLGGSTRYPFTIAAGSTATFSAIFDPSTFSASDLSNWDSGKFTLDFFPDQGFTCSIDNIVIERMGPSNSDRFDSALVVGGNVYGSIVTQQHGTSTLSLTNNPSELPVGGSGYALKVAAATQYSGCYMTPTDITAGVTYTLSVGIRAISGNTTFYIAYYNGSSTSSLFMDLTQTGSQVANITFTAGSDPTKYPIHIFTAGGSGTFSVDNFVIVYPTQILFSSSYNVSGSRIITNVTPGTTVSAFRNSMTIPEGSVLSLAFQDPNGVALSDGASVGTDTNIVADRGSEIDTYKMIMYGDVNGDGAINLSDLVLMRDNILGISPLGADFQTAGDLYGEGNISLNDLVGMMSYISGSGTISGNGSPALLTAAQVIAAASPSDLTCTGYDVKKFTEPFYNNQIQYNEGVFLRKNLDGTINPAPLYFKPAQILEVRSEDMKTLYTAGTDYTLNSNGMIVIPTGSRIQAMNYTTYFTPTLTGNDWYYNLNGTLVPTTSSTTDMYAAKIVVTYIRTTPYTGYKPVDKSAIIPTFTNDLKSNKNINIIYVGDSITAGAGQSGNFKRWTDVVTDGIQSRTSGTVTEYNAGIPGANTGDFINLMNGHPELLPSSVNQTSAVASFNLAAAQAPTADLIFIAFGTNDAGGWMSGGTSAAAYSANVKTIINYYRTLNPKASIILVAGTQPNTNVWTNSTTKLVGVDMTTYADAMSAIESSGSSYANSGNLAYVDVFRMQQTLLSVKTDQATFLGDNCNHPDDYMTRVYAQTVLATLIHNY